MQPQHGTVAAIQAKWLLLLVKPYTSSLAINPVVGSVVELLKCRAYDQHGLGSKPTRAILLCPWRRHFTALSPTWWSWQAVLIFNHISIKLPANSIILESAEARRSNCLPYVLAPPSLSCKSGG